MRRGRALAAGLALLLTAVAGCEGVHVWSVDGTIAYVADPRPLPSGVDLAVRRIEAAQSELTVELRLTNRSPLALVVDYDGIELRLPDEPRAIARAAGLFHWRRRVELRPGASREIRVAFRDPGMDMRYYKEVSLVVGGISSAGDRRPRPASEIRLVPTSAPPPWGSPQWR